MPDNILPSKLLWVDLEMTGLNPASDVILEVAAIVTDFDFKTLATFEAVIHQPEDKLALLNDWSRQQHRASGLLGRVRASDRAENEIASELAALIKHQFGGESAVLAGNSIHQDRAFIRQWWPEVEQLLHYRMLDVSAWKIIMQTKFAQEFEKKETHRALGDIEESIAELKSYLDYFKTS